MKQAHLRARKTRKSASSGAPVLPSKETVSLEECKKYLETFQLTDERIIEIRNSMVGIVDSIINGYLENFE